MLSYRDKVNKRDETVIDYKTIHVICNSIVASALGWMAGRKSDGDLKGRKELDKLFSASEMSQFQPD